MKTVAHIKSTYLNRSETWFYTLIKSHVHYNPVIISENVVNTSEFPFERILKLPHFSTIKRLLGFFGRMFTFTHPVIEEALEKAIKGAEAKVIHAHFMNTGLYTLKVAKKLDLPLVVSFYGFDTRPQGLLSNQYSYPLLSKIFDKNQNFRSGIFKLFFFWLKFIPALSLKYWEEAMQMIFTEADFIITFGERMRKDLISLGCPKDKIMDIHTGFDVSQRDYKEKKFTKSGKIKFLMVNRLVDKKGVKYAIEAFAKLTALHDNIEMNIIGDGPLKESLQALTEKLKIEDKIKFLGSKSYDECLDYMNESHIFISPSIKADDGDDEGGINTTIIDAMSLGLLCVATKECGSQLIYHEETGYLAKEKSSDDLATVINQAINNSHMWGVITKAARQLLEREFNQSIQIKKLETVYDIVISKYE